MQKFLETYQKLNIKTLDRLADIYSPDIHFIDPAHEIRGLAQLAAYFHNLFSELTTIDFEFAHPIGNDTEGYVQWQMHFRHPRIKGGDEVAVPGATFLKFAPDHKAIFHQDYFDLGKMIYQHLPLMGKIIAGINRRLGS